MCCSLYVRVCVPTNCAFVPAMQQLLSPQSWEEQGQEKWHLLATKQTQAAFVTRCVHQNSKEEPDSGTRRLYGCMTAWLHFEQGTKIQVEKPLDWNL